MSELQGSNMDKRSVEYQPSETAMGAATLRALSAIDERKEYRGTDYLAEIFLTEERKKILKDFALRDWVIKSRIIPGMYEFVIARTTFFDHIVEEALRENIPQIVFMGAGYDSRPYRFRNLIKNTRIFELDSLYTQQRKKELLHQAYISIPEQLTFVSINFNADDLGDVLAKAGYTRSQEVLFVWEGVTYYLSADVIDDTLSVIRKNAPPGSAIGFDYASLSPEVLNDNSVKTLRDMMRSHYPGEPTLFGVPEGNIESFLSERGYMLKVHCAPIETRRAFLSLPDGSPARKLLALFRFAYALVSD